MSGELTGDLISKWINFKLYPESLEEPFFSLGVILACVPSGYHCAGIDPVKEFLGSFFNRGSEEAEIEIVSSKMDIQDSLLIENSTVNIIPKKPTLEWLIPEKLSHIYVGEKKITLDMSMTLQFSDETLFKIKLEWDPAEVQIQILPEGASLNQVQATQEDVPQPNFSNEPFIEVEAINEAPEDVITTLEQPSHHNQVIPQEVSSIVEGSVTTTEAIPKEVSSSSKHSDKILTEEISSASQEDVIKDFAHEEASIVKDSENSGHVISKKPTKSSFVVTNPDPSYESADSATEVTENKDLDIIREPETNEAFQLTDENPKETIQDHNDLSNAPDEKTLQVEEETVSKKPLPSRESAPLIKPKPHTPTNKRVTSKSTVAAKPTKSHNGPIVAKKPNPIKKPTALTAVSEPSVRKVASSPRIVRKPSQQSLPRSTSSLSRQSNASSRSSHSLNHLGSQSSSLPKAFRQTSLGPLSTSPNPTTRRCDPQRLKSQIDFSHGPASTSESPRPVKKDTSPSSACAHKILSRQEISARHLATSFTIGKEEPSTGPTKHSAPPAWAKELRPYLNKGSTTIRL